MTTAPTPSASLVRAARAEDERIARALAGLDRRREALNSQLAELDVEAAVLRERQGLLRRLTGDRDAPEAGGRALRAVATKLLKGRELRRVAAGLLWRTEGGAEIQYRDWLERVLASGYAIAGKDPAASFLTNVRDSPAVVHGSRPGFYRLDPVRRVAVVQQLAEAQAELRDVVDVLARPSVDADDRARRDELRAHRTRLTARVRSLEADVAELDAIFADGVEAAVGPAETTARATDGPARAA